MGKEKSSKKKRASVLFMLKSTVSGFFYLVRRNIKQKKEKMKLKKYDPTVRKHVLFEEKKLK